MKKLLALLCFVICGVFAEAQCPVGALCPPGNQPFVIYHSIPGHLQIGVISAEPFSTPFGTLDAGFSIVDFDSANGFIQLFFAQPANMGFEYQINNTATGSRSKLTVDKTNINLSVTDTTQISDIDIGVTDSAGDCGIRISGEGIQ